MPVARVGWALAVCVTPAPAAPQRGTWLPADINAFENRAGKPFSDLVAQSVFEPAGMKRSARVQRCHVLSPDLATALATLFAVRPH